jgi:hypothetical protein
MAIAGTVAAGCAAQDGPADGQPGMHPSQVTDDCAGRIDAEITAGIVPNADREYAEGMCRAGR